jgi:flagellar biogenesis protein FliO
MFILRLIILLAIVAILLWLLRRLFSPESEPERLKSARSENVRQCK